MTSGYVSLNFFMLHCGTKKAVMLYKNTVVLNIELPKILSGLRVIWNNGVQLYTGDTCLLPEVGLCSVWILGYPNDWGPDERRLTIWNRICDYNILGWM